MPGPVQAKRGRRTGWMRLLGSLLLLCGGFHSVSAQTRRFPVTTLQVLVALSRPELPLNAAQISLPAVVLAASENEALHMESVSLNGDTDLRVRLRCATAAACSPFLASLHFESKPTAESAKQILSSSILPAVPIRSLGLVTVHAQQRVFLLITSARMRIRIPAVSMDTGSVGSAVRVASLDHQTIFHAVVSDANSVEAELP